MSMNFIQRVRFIHSEFDDKCGGDKKKVDHAFQKECCMEIGYQIEEKISSKGGKVNYEIFRGIDNIFQLAFRTREIWELIDQIFELWETLASKFRR